MNTKLTMVEINAKHHTNMKFFNRVANKAGQGNAAGVVKEKHMHVPLFFMYSRWIHLFLLWAPLHLLPDYNQCPLWRHILVCSNDLYSVNSLWISPEKSLSKIPYKAQFAAENIVPGSNLKLQSQKFLIII